MCPRYHLDTSSRKYICPSCHRKTFVRYLDAEGHSLSAEVGRCDRQDKCRYHYPPRLYFADNRWRQPSPGRFMAEPRRRPDPDFIPRHLMLRSMRGYGDNSLVRFLHSRFDALLGAETVEGIVKEYAVGTSTLYGGSPLFWQVDPQGNIRTGKIMGYDATTGRRVRHPRPLFAWVHKMLHDKPEYRLRQAYFGSHRLAFFDSIKLTETSKPHILLMESEKSALVMALSVRWGWVHRQMLPMACGGCDGFNPNDERLRDPFDALAALRGLKVTLYPDQGKYEEWSEKARKLEGVCDQVIVNPLLEKLYHGEPLYKINSPVGRYDLFKLPAGITVSPGDGFDDLILRYIEAGIDEDSLVDLLFMIFYCGECGEKLNEISSKSLCS